MAPLRKTVALIYSKGHENASVIAFLHRRMQNNQIRWQEVDYGELNECAMIRTVVST